MQILKQISRNYIRKFKYREFSLIPFYFFLRPKKPIQLSVEGLA